MSTYLRGTKIGNIFVELENGHQYLARTQNNITIVEINDADDVPQLLIKRCGCCNATYLCFRVATQEDVNLWNSIT